MIAKRKGIPLEEEDEVLGETHVEDEVFEIEAVEEEITEEETLEDKVLRLEEEIAEEREMSKRYFNRLARAQAGLENYKKRLEREKDEHIRKANERLLHRLLIIMDSFESAFNSLEKKRDIDRLIEGLKMIYEQLKNLLMSEGVTPIEALGRSFDPSVHKALDRVTTDKYPEGNVIEELRKGYMLKDRCLRPSEVTVSALPGEEEHHNEK